MEVCSIFAYGSLMWNPGFEFLSARLARLDGYRRALNVVTSEHRGSKDCPGLVFNLVPDSGASTAGVLYTVSSESIDRVKHYLDYRERITNTDFYDCQLMEVDGLAAYVYLVPESSPYIFTGSLYEQAKVVSAASGTSGSNLDYLMDCIHYLREHNEIDYDLELLASCAQQSRDWSREKVVNAAELG